MGWGARESETFHGTPVLSYKRSGRQINVSSKSSTAAACAGHPPDQSPFLKAPQAGSLWALEGPAPSDFLL